MIINYSQEKYIDLTEADQFVLQYMLGMIGQGHGHHRVRGLVPAVKYIRLTYGLSLEHAVIFVRGYEKSVANCNIS